MAANARGIPIPRPIFAPSERPALGSGEGEAVGGGVFVGSVDGWGVSVGEGVSVGGGVSIDDGVSDGGESVGDDVFVGFGDCVGVFDGFLVGEVVGSVEETHFESLEEDLEDFSELVVARGTTSRGCRSVESTAATLCRAVTATTNNTENRIFDAYAGRSNCRK
ncbi:unnamed protein product [Periconia digitata]|uniref:Uncharacterized protein n=1 Tax=Periconia digitata TaxID=1303443 RepID=A0A9W4XQ60_9PLEO|nr:unnamed protein product [Periconia digitata]